MKPTGHAGGPPDPEAEREKARAAELRRIRKRLEELSDQNADLARDNANLRREVSTMRTVDAKAAEFWDAWLCAPWGHGEVMAAAQVLFRALEDRHGERGADRHRRLLRGGLRVG